MRKIPEQAPGPGGQNRQRQTQGPLRAGILRPGRPAKPAGRLDEAAKIIKSRCRGGYQPPARYKLTTPNQVGRIRTNAKLLNSKTCSLFHSTKHSGYQPGGRLRASPTVAGGRNNKFSAAYHQFRKRRDSLWQNERNGRLPG